MCIDNALCQVYDGARLWKRINQNPTNIQVWIGNLYEEKGGKTLFHVFAGNQQVCTFETNSVLYGGSNTTNVGYYYNEDSLNTSSALSDSSHNQIEVNVYFPFGRTQTATPQASFQVSRRFTGQVFDAESGLYYYNARYYDPELGRFIQPDTEIPDLSNPQSYNRYSYCVNDPLRYNDPTGHDFEQEVNDFMDAVMAASPVTGGAEKSAVTIAEDAPKVARAVEASAVAVVKGVAASSEELGKAAKATGDAIESTYDAFKAGEKAKKSLGKLPGQTVDPTTGKKVQKFIVDPKGNTMIEPAGGTTKKWGRGGADTHTTYPNGSPYQRLDNSHGAPHGHGQLPGTGPGKAGTGPSLDPSGNVVPNTSPGAHWPVNH